MTCTPHEAWLAAAVEYFTPGFAVHGYRWGRTDASVAEPGAYLAAVILVPLFALFLWSFFRATSPQSAVSQRAESMYLFLRDAVRMLDRFNRKIDCFPKHHLHSIP